VRDLVKALVVYYSRFGNTEKIAEALAEGLQRGGIETKTTRVDEVRLDEVRQNDLICIGTPVHAWNIPTPVKDFLNRLKGMFGLSRKKAFAFDTKLESRLAGSASNKVEEILKALGFSIAKPANSVIVRDIEGPLEEGAEQAFKQTGEELVSMM
jgi:flavodoxin